MRGCAQSIIDAQTAEIALMEQMIGDLVGEARQAQQLVSCLRALGEVVVCGKRGRALLYRRAA